jgi:hypothetical protein
MNTNELLSTFTATVEPKGAKFVHTIRRNGEVFDTRTSAKRYAYATIQVWVHEGAIVADSAGTPAATADDVMAAARYSAKPIAAGRRIDYGQSAGNVEFLDA